MATAYLNRTLTACLFAATEKPELRRKPTGSRRTAQAPPSAATSPAVAGLDPGRMVSPAIACVDPAHQRPGEVGSTIKRVELERHVLTAITDQLLAPKAILRLVARDHAEVDGRQSDRKRDTAVVTGGPRRRKRRPSAWSRRSPTARSTSARSAKLWRQRVERDSLLRERQGIGAAPVTRSIRRPRNVSQACHRSGHPPQREWRTEPGDRGALARHDRRRAVHASTKAPGA
jgi:hypothetical protein